MSGPPPKTPPASTPRASQAAAPAETTTTAPIPSMVPPGYAPIRLLGQGAMGLVIHARDEQLDREVAVKVLKPSHESTPEIRAALLSEARAIARVKHPALVEIHSCGELDGQPYLVMEYLEGQSLEQWMEARKGAPVPLDLVTGIMTQITEGVATLHEAGAVHRDIKAANVMINADHRIKLVDFGLANVEGERGFKQGTRAGTPDYMAPELIRKGLSASTDDAPADIYALGVLTYLLLTGRLPFEKYEDMRQVIKAQVNEAPVPPSFYRLDLPPAFDAVVFRAMSKLPAARPTAKRMAQRIARARGVIGEQDVGNRLRVLCVDDDPDLCAWIKELIESQYPDARVRVVNDGREALDVVDDFMPDLVVTDLDMPRLNGIELAAVLAERPATSAIPVLVMSAQGGGRDWALLKEIGAAKMLLKPLDAEDFLHDMKRVLSRHRKSLRGQ